MIAIPGVKAAVIYLPLVPEATTSRSDQSTKRHINDQSHVEHTGNLEYAIEYFFYLGFISANMKDTPYVYLEPAPICIQPRQFIVIYYSNQQEIKYNADSVADQLTNLP